MPDPVLALVMWLREDLVKMSGSLLIDNSELAASLDLPGPCHSVTFLGNAFMCLLPLHMVLLLPSTSICEDALVV